MSDYYKLTNEDRVFKLDGELVYVFDNVTNEWVVDSANLITGKIDTLDENKTGDCLPISPDEARAWIARKADRVE